MIAIYSDATPLSHPLSSWTLKSEYVLYDNSTFTLRFASSPGSNGSEYRGSYQQSNGTLTMVWAGWSAAGPWQSTAELKDDMLTVQYNDIMQMDDFENAAYHREQ